MSVQVMQAPAEPAQQREQRGAALLQAAAQRRRRRTMAIVSGQVLLLVAILVGWQLSSGHLANTATMSSPSLIWETGRQWLSDGQLLSNTWQTVKEAVLGFVIGALGGVISGILLGVVPMASRLFSPYINVLYALPKIALGPLFVVWFGITMELKVVLAAIFVYFLVLYNTWTSIREVDQGLVNVLRLMGGNRWTVVVKVMLPSAVVWLFLSLRISFPNALIGAMLGELLASNQGLGYLINMSASTYDLTGIWVAILALVIVSVIFDRALSLLQGVVERRYGRERV